MPHSALEKNTYYHRRRTDPLWVEAERLKRRAWYERTREDRNRYAREWAAKNRDKTRAGAKRHRQRSWPAVALTLAKGRAKARGLAFDITVQDIVLPPLCPVLGTPLAPAGEDRDQWPSVDRIDNARGYVKGNVRVISLRANFLKGDATLDELKRLVCYIEQETLGWS